MTQRRINIWSLLIFGIFILSSVCHAQPEKAKVSSPFDPFYLFFNVDSVYAEPDWILQKQLGDYLTRLEKLKKRQKSDYQFLKQVFYKTHKKFLLRYDPSATLPYTFETGTYGCLSGTALYALIFRHFGYEYDIIETPSHVYLNVNLPEQQVIIESTLPLEGFVTGKKKIKAATQQYASKSRKHTSIVAVSGIDLAPGTPDYGKKIDLKELSGLQYYNMSIYNMAEENLEEAMVNAQKSLTLYPSIRTEKLMEIVINKILQSKTLSKDQKAGILNNYVRQVKKKRLTQR